MVHLKDFSVLSPTIQNSDLLKAIEIAIPAMAMIIKFTIKGHLGLLSAALSVTMNMIIIIDNAIVYFLEVLETPT